MNNRQGSGFTWRHLMAMAIIAYIVYAGFLRPQKGPDMTQPTPTRVYATTPIPDVEYLILQHEATIEKAEQEYYESLHATAMQEVYDSTLATEEALESIAATVQAERLESLVATIDAWEEIEQAIATWQPWAEDY